MNKMTLTKSELEIMKVFWGENRPLSRHDILSLSVDKTWKSSSIHILLNGLLKKEAIVESGFTKCGKTYGRLYAANISCEDYYTQSVFSHNSDAGLPLLFSALISSDKLTTEMVDELEEMLRKRREELK